MSETTLLRLSLQTALLGEVTQNLVAVTAGISNSKIFIRAYFDEKASESETERISEVGTEVIAKFPDSYDIEEQVFFTNEGKPKMLDFWAFVRADTEVC